MSSLLMPGSMENPAVITQLKQALEGDVAALGEVIDTILSEPEGFVQELRKAALDERQRRSKSDSSQPPTESESLPPRISEHETRLLQKINEGLPEATWSKYHALRQKFDDRTLTTEEHQDLIALTNEIETAHAKRLAFVWELAKLRGKSLEGMMEELGIAAPGVK